MAFGIPYAYMKKKATRRKGEGKTKQLDHKVAGTVCFYLAIRSKTIRFYVLQKL